ncbi:hypothetical protein Ddye_024043 [Dipteronia dyeriana]|uniref:Uncharacterized protein n=1 Tax=Dipteronia dyeriana TaxID=168575 RepID=A0AAD9TV06_9ROSI|nr:hypothetical protein Ddye_024043 [Dipteronia dyeriana]
MAVSSSSSSSPSSSSSRFLTVKTITPDMPTAMYTARGGRHGGRGNPHNVEVVETLIMDEGIFPPHLASPLIIMGGRTEDFFLTCLMGILHLLLLNKPHNLGHQDPKSSVRFLVA